MILRKGQGHNPFVCSLQKMPNKPRREKIRAAIGAKEHHANRKKISETSKSNEEKDMRRAPEHKASRNCWRKSDRAHATRAPANATASARARNGYGTWRTPAAANARG